MLRKIQEIFVFFTKSMENYSDYLLYRYIIYSMLG